MNSRRFRLAGIVAAAALAFSAGSAPPLDYITDHIQGPVVTVHGSGDPGTLSILFLGDGFTADAASMDAYRAAVDRAVAELLATGPFGVLANTLSIYRLDVISDQPGIDVPVACPKDSVDPNNQFDTPPPPPGPVFNWSRSPRQVENALETTWCAPGALTGHKKWFLNADGDRIAQFIAATDLTPTMTVVLVNDWMYGATAWSEDGLVFVSIGQNLIGDINPDSGALLEPNKPDDYPAVVVHEIGHLKPFKLLDEYSNGNTGVLADQTAAINAGANVTTILSPLKWQALVSPGTPIPTSCGLAVPPEVGAYEGGYGFATGVYRSRCQCRMDNHRHPSFCVVCRQKIVQALSSFMPLIDYEPPRTDPKRVWVFLDSIQLLGGPSGAYSIEYTLSIGPERSTGRFPSQRNGVELGRGQAVEAEDFLGSFSRANVLGMRFAKLEYFLNWRPPGPMGAGAKPTQTATETYQIPLDPLKSGLITITRPTHRLTLGVLVPR